MKSESEIQDDGAVYNPVGGYPKEGQSEYRDSLFQVAALGNP